MQVGGLGQVTYSSCRLYDTTHHIDHSFASPFPREYVAGTQLNGFTLISMTS